MPYQPGCRLQVNVDQITYLQRGAKDEYTRIHFVGTDRSIGVQEVPQQIMGKRDLLYLSHPKLAARVSTSGSCHKRPFASQELPAVVGYFDRGAKPGEQFYTDAGRSTSASFPDHGGCHARFTTLPR